MITLAAADTLAGGACTPSVLTYTIFGMELTVADKTEEYKVLAQGQLSNTAATLYTAPSGKVGFIKTITVVNNHTAACLLSLYRGGTAAANRITPPLRIEAGGMAVYSDGTGWAAYNSNGQQLLASVGSAFQFNNRKVLAGALFETFDRDMCDEVNSSVLSSGRMSLAAIWIPAGTLITSISFWSATTAAGTPTNQLFGLYDQNLNLLATSVNDTTNAWATNSRKTLNLTTPYTTTYSGLYYLAIMVTATTVPTLKGNTAKTGGQLSAGAPSMGGTSNTGLTTALPATATAPGTVTASFWGCVN